MPRRARISTGGLAYHILNRRGGRLALFDKPADYIVFEKILSEAHQRTGVPIAASHAQPLARSFVAARRWRLSEAMRWITVTHTQRWHAHRQTSGSGPVYQGRFKSFPVQTDEHFLTVARYVERNALRAKLVKRAEGWQWSSLWRWTEGVYDAVRRDVGDFPGHFPYRQLFLWCFNAILNACNRSSSMDQRRAVTAGASLP